MATNENATRPTREDPRSYIDTLDDPVRRADCMVLLDLMQRLSGEPPTMWGPAMIGFGSYHYRYASGREGDWLRAGFAPRRQNLVVYVMMGFGGQQDLLARLGRHKTGKSCLYINRLADIELEVLEEIVVRALAEMERQYPRNAG